MKQLSLAATAVLLIILALVVYTKTTGMQTAFSGLTPAADPLPEYWPAPDFTLTNQAGEMLTREDLLGKVWAADFFFTSCPGICPMLSANMQAMNADLADHPRRDQLRLVSFSLDPANDTTQVLAEYAEAIGVTPDDWLFFTGDRQALWDLSIEGFKLEVADTPDDPVNPILHSGKVILIDRQGMIRGFYEGLVPEGMAQLQADLRRLLEE
ncbi:MAG: SCO family protein [Planctomycetota bacterium]